MQAVLDELTSQGVTVLHNVDATLLGPEAHQRGTSSCSRPECTRTEHPHSEQQPKHHTGNGSDECSGCTADEPVATDAYQEIRSTLFDAIIFQFPHTHGGKMKIGQQRILLEAFFRSASALLQHYALQDAQSAQTSGGKLIATVIAAVTVKCSTSQVHICSLHLMGCSADALYFEVIELAARAGLVLKEARRFEDEEWALHGYRSKGYRATGARSFRVEHSVTHVFVLEGQGIPCAEAHEHIHEVSFFCGSVGLVRQMLVTQQKDAAEEQQTLVSAALKHLDNGGVSSDIEVARLCAPSFDEAHFREIVLETAQGAVTSDAITFRELYVEPVGGNPGRTGRCNDSVRASNELPGVSLHGSSVTPSHRQESSDHGNDSASGVHAASPEPCVQLVAEDRSGPHATNPKVGGTASKMGDLPQEGAADSVSFRALHMSPRSPPPAPLSLVAWRRRPGDGPCSPKSDVEQPHAAFTDAERRVKLGYKIAYCAEGMDMALSRERSVQLMLACRSRLETAMGIAYV
ncbi:hypothetical protein JKP88DRAFT_266365 [Tribonema minus]|uniref:25S rRNA (uridine-N(3))-methyltransferase BMT5-like domain-containing protein n=1 Tax=Tribonema minus TaxID=303371 RepID=A0A836CNU3_9STRA|nr:hypothetical protein JKP88DRAFT_266365 [Tribonema minus]